MFSVQTAMYPTSQSLLPCNPFNSLPNLHLSRLLLQLSRINSRLVTYMSRLTNNVYHVIVLLLLTLPKLVNTAKATARCLHL